MPRPPKQVLFSKKEVGQRIRDLRDARSLTQIELATAIGVTQSNLSAIERGARGLTVHQVVKLARALKASTDDILNPRGKEAPAEKGLPDDRRFVRRLQKIDQLPRRDQQALLRTIDAYLKAL